MEQRASIQLINALFNKGNLLQKLDKDQLALELYNEAQDINMRLEANFTESTLNHHLILLYMNKANVLDNLERYSGLMRRQKHAARICQEAARSHDGG